MIPFWLQPNGGITPQQLSTLSDRPPLSTVSYMCASSPSPYPWIGPALGYYGQQDAEYWPWSWEWEPFQYMHPASPQSPNLPIPRLTATPSSWIPSPVF